MIQKINNFALALFFLPIFGFSQAGSPDLTFGISGKTELSSGTNAVYGGGTVVLPDGKIIVVWYDYTATSSQVIITRLLPDGTPDADFGLNGNNFPNLNVGDGGISKIALAADGKIIGVGTRITANEYSAFVARFNTDGTLDESFGTNGVTTYSTGLENDFYSVLIKSDGKILAGGSISVDPNTISYDLLLVQLMPNGAFDPNFGVAGVAKNDLGAGFEAIISMALQADGKIVGVGGFGTTNYNMEVERYNVDGSIDATFATNGVLKWGTAAKEDVAYDVVVQQDQKIVFCGSSFKSNSTQGEFTVFRVNADGGFDNSFDADGRLFKDAGFFEFAREIALQSDGKLLVGGDNSTTSTLSDGQIWVYRINMDGTIDNSFGVAGQAISSIDNETLETTSLVLQPDGKIISTSAAAERIILWRFNNSPILAANEAAKLDVELKISPNPVSAAAVLHFSLKKEARIACELMDSEGRFLQNIISANGFSAGSFEIPIFLNEKIASGVCFLKFSVDNQTTVLPILKVK
jgi:uncharacterized delta-60 repeat protein